VGNGIAIDPAGNAYVAGATSSPDLPGTSNYSGPAYDPTDPSTDGDAFAAKYSPQGALLWTRLVGGAESDYAVALSLDSLGNLYIAGNTASADFPTTAESIPSCRSTMGPFVAELYPDGKNLLRSKFRRLCREDRLERLARGVCGLRVERGQLRSWQPGVLRRHRRAATVCRTESDQRRGALRSKEQWN